ncbi:MAG: site-2 protease family protein [Patescibacteria group bacterium]|mgnify:CR=1 FL=1
MLSTLFSEPISFLLWIMAVVYAITVHEFSHVLAAHALGDKTGEQLGRLTLNPLVHIDWLGLVALLLIGFGWGNPAPYDPRQLRIKKWGPALVALAGPASNIVSAVVFGVALHFLSTLAGLGTDNLLLNALLLLVLVNIALLLFNLIPIPPLDGSQVLLTLLPDRFFSFKVALLRQGPMILIFLLIFDGFLPGLSIFGRLFGWVWALTSSLL